MPKYITRQGDTVDLICYLHYGTERDGTVEAVLEANTGLADYGTVLPLGITIDLPVVETTETNNNTIINLWD